MHSDVALLLEVQELDVEHLELQEHLNMYPGIWEEVKEDLRKKSAALEKCQAANQDHEKDRQQIERDLRASADTLKKYQAQQMLVKTSKELTAISTQIETLKSSIARLEERGVRLIDQDEAVRAALATAEEEFRQAKARAKTERERIRDQVASKKERMEAVEKARAGIAANIEREALVLYERIRQRWPKNPVVAVRNGSCTGCHYALLPNELVALHHEENIICCDTCSRILSHDETLGAGAAAE